MPFGKGCASSRSIISCRSKSTAQPKPRVIEEGPAQPKFPIALYENVEGRNFQPDKSGNQHHFLPCDDEEFERLQVNHWLFRSLFGRYGFLRPEKRGDLFITENARIYFAPVQLLLENGAKVLLVGCGPGFWLREMAEAYPKSHFTGIDAIIYPISMLPKNCHVRVATAPEGLPFADNSFDFVVQHDMAIRYTRKQWDDALKELVRVTKPGGYLELVEQSNSMQDIGPNTSIWMMRLTVSLQTRNIMMKIAPQLHDMLQETGLVTDVEYSHRSLPIGWLGKLGDVALDAMERLFDSMKPRLCEDWSMTREKYDKMVQTAIRECREFQSWTNVHYIYCRKAINGATIPKP